MSQVGGNSYPYDAKNANLYQPRMSLSQSDALGLGMDYRQSQYGGSQYFGQQELELTNLAGLPSDDAILAEIREILKTADLMTVTKKSIKVELERRFGVQLDARRAYINSGRFHAPMNESLGIITNTVLATEALLSGQL
jgi:chitin synthase